MIWLSNQLKVRGMTQRELAHTIGMTETMFSNVIAGRRTFKAREVDAIRRAFGFVLPEDQPQTITVAGRVGAGDAITLIDDHAKGDGLFHIARPNWLPSSGVVAAQIDGSSAEPWALSGDIIFWRRDAMAVLGEDLGRPVVAELEDGRVMLKRLASGSEPGTWSLLSINPAHPNVMNVRLKWAARVFPPLPKDEVRYMSA